MFLEIGSGRLRGVEVFGSGNTIQIVVYLLIGWQIFIPLGCRASLQYTAKRHGRSLSRPFSITIEKIKTSSYLRKKEFVIAADG